MTETATTKKVASSLDNSLLNVSGLYSQISSMVHTLCVTFRENCSPGTTLNADFDHNISNQIGSGCNVEVVSMCGDDLTIKVPGRTLLRPKNNRQVELTYSHKEVILVVKASFLTDKIVGGDTHAYLKINDIGVRFSDEQFISAKCHD